MTIQLLLGPAALWLRDAILFRRLTTRSPRENGRLAHKYGHALHTGSLYVRETRARCQKRWGKKKSINNTDYWFWHRRWRGGRHHRNRTMCTRRHHALYPSESLRHRRRSALKYTPPPPTPPSPIRDVRWSLFSKNPTSLESRQKI